MNIDEKEQKISFEYNEEITIISRNGSFVLVKFPDGAEYQATVLKVKG